MIAFKLYLLSGLVAHKLLWEILKRKAPAAPEAPTGSPLGLRVVKIAKLAVLIGIIVQTISPDVFPISNDATLLRVFGGILFTAGLAIAVTARIQLGKNWSDIEDGKILERHEVVCRGIYRYVRHPIYVGDLLLLLGLQLSLNSWLVLLVVGLAPVVLRQAIREEGKLMASLPGYREYSMRTKRFIPFVV